MTTNAPFAPINLRNERNSNWITGTIGTLKVQAKVYDEPSQYGMELEGRISKLWVALPGTPRIVLYSYDRGLETDRLTTEGLVEIIAAVMSVA